MRTLIFAGGLGLLLLAGCATPLPSYQKVDQAAPAFKEAVARETQNLQVAGQSAAQAEKNAVKTVTAQFIATEAKRRQDLVAPLVRALRAMQQPAGCWAYTVTTTTRMEKDAKAKVEIEAFDPSQPEARAWTLISTDGKAPDEKAQADYRRKKSSEKKDASGKKIVVPPANSNPAESRVLQDALNDDFQTLTDDPGTTTFVFTQEKVSLSALVSAHSAHFAYLVDDATGTLRRVAVALKGVSAMAGLVKVDPVDAAMDFSVVDPAVPPFIAKVSVNFNARILFMGTFAATVEKIYSNYHRVPCYDDRFQVKMGPLEIINDTLPH